MIERRKSLSPESPEAKRERRLKQLREDVARIEARIKDFQERKISKEEADMLDELLSDLADKQSELARVELEA